MDIKKEMLFEILTYLVEDTKDKEKTLIALKDLLNTSIAEEESVRLTINAIYGRYLRDTEIYIKIFQELKLDFQQDEREVEEEKPTKREVETKQKQEELEDIEIKETKSLEEEAEEHEQNKFREKMKESSTESILDKLNILRKK